MAVFDPVTGQMVDPATGYLSPETLAMMQPQMAPQMTPAVPPDAFLAPPVAMPAPMPVVDPGAVSAPPVPGPAMPPAPRFDAGGMRIPDPVVPAPTGPATPDWIDALGVPEEQKAALRDKRDAGQMKPAEPAAPVPGEAAKVAEQKFQFATPGGSVTDQPKAPSSTMPGMGDVTRGISGQKTAIQDQAAIESAKQLGLADLERQNQDYLQKSMENDKAIRTKYEGKIAEHQKSLDTAIASASEPINARRFWQKKSGMEKVGAAIAIAMGAMGDAINKAYGGSGTGGNQALNIIMSSIQDDIDEQKANKAGAQAGVGNQFQLYSKLRTEFGDDLAAEAGAKAGYLEAAKSRVAELIAAAGSKDAQARGAQLMSALDVELGKNKLAVAQWSQEQAGKDANSVSKYVPGVGLALGDKEKGEAQDVAANWASFSQSINEIRKLRASSGGEALPTRAAKDMQQASIRAKNALRNIWGLSGRPPNDRVEKMFEKLIPADPSSKMSRSSTIEHEMTGILKNVAQDVNNTLSTRMVPMPGQRFFIPEADPAFWGEAAQ